MLSVLLLLSMEELLHFEDFGHLCCEIGPFGGKEQRWEDVDRLAWWWAYTYEMNITFSHIAAAAFLTWYS